MTVRIKIDNNSISEEQAKADAMEIFDQTGEPVEVCRMLGDPVLYITKEGQVILY